MRRTPLPIDALLPDVVGALRHAGALILQAATGAGKTTRVPLALYESGMLGEQEIILLEPRRLAARAAARRIAFELNCPVGDLVGYQVRFDSRVSRRTKIRVVTPGILLRQLQDDPYLESVGAILFDEFHERSLEADMLLGLTRLIRETVRPELRTAILSATLDVEPLAKYFGDCPVISSEGRRFPVEVRYHPRRQETPLPVSIDATTRDLLDDTDGDILVFLPGLREIRHVARQLESWATDCIVLPLHGDLHPDEQDRAIQPSEQRKIILATNVAETSVTIDGITGVIDTGLARINRFDDGLGMDRLEIEWISRASADQRLGRAGRTQAGVCIRLWSEAENRSRRDHLEPEVHRVDLAAAVLQLLRLGERDPEKFPWLDAPSSQKFDQAKLLLHRLGALHGNELTTIGQRMAELPVHPRVGRLLLAGEKSRVSERAALAAALLTEKDPFSRASRVIAPTRSDLLDRIEAIENFESTNQSQSKLGSLHIGSARFLLQARNQLLKLIESHYEPNREEDAFLKCLLAAYPDRVVKRRPDRSRRGKMVGGRGVELASYSGVDSEWFLALDVEAGGTESIIRLASEVEREWLPTQSIRSETVIEFDESNERLEAIKRIWFEDLIIEEKPAGPLRPDQLQEGLFTAARSNLSRVLPEEESNFQRWLVRVNCLRGWMPALNLPEYSQEVLQEMLTWLVPGCRSFADIRKGDWLGIAKGRLSRDQLKAIENEAPETIEVPSGSHIKLQYQLGQAPILAVRIQELFGLETTPTVAAGSVPVLLHLLAPNYRPQQVTTDLASFWMNTYPTVKKELRGRYPKHSWPDDPLSADAICGARRRQQS
jgi:ATP-dependent helicase HrpB